MMREQVFQYKGKELVTKLTTLLARLSKRLHAVSLQLLQLPPIEQGGGYFEHLPVVDMMNRAQSGKERVNLTVQRDGLEASTKRAKLWLEECQRTPRRTFLLDFKDLEWLTQ